MTMLTQQAIHFAKHAFEDALSQTLHLTKVSAPLFVDARSGIQDNLNGTERPIQFTAKTIPHVSLEIVQSLAKWKRLALARLQTPVGEGIYTDMRAIRPDEEDLHSGIHSIYVDQWDWEKVITPEDRNLDTLKTTVTKIYSAIKTAEKAVCTQYTLPSILPDNITFVHTEELVDTYPDLTPKQREDAITQKHGAVFLIGIGGTLQDGSMHDGRAPDYDDWSLNGDILVWNPILKRAFEVSSMGIRVDQATLRKQLAIRHMEDRATLPWHQMLLNGELPASIGGGIGQSRLAMLLLQKKHIGEVQHSIWPEDIRTTVDHLLE